MTELFDGHRPQEGIHVLKGHVKQKSHFGLQSQTLCENDSLNLAIQATSKAAPWRSKRVREEGEHVYQLNRGVSVSIDPTERERLWERAAFIRWSNKKTSPISSCWSQLVAFQVPLFVEAKKNGWGYIDLLGILNDGTISVVELKKEPETTDEGGTGTSESPLRMVLESMAYAIAIREDWAHFRKELVSRLEVLTLGKKLIDSIPISQPVKIRLVGVAPAAYWLDWLPLTDKGKSVAAEEWKSFLRLLEKVKTAGFPTSFLSLSGEPGQPESLAAQPLNLTRIISVA